LQHLVAFHVLARFLPVIPNLYRFLPELVNRFSQYFIHKLFTAEIAA